MWDYCGSAAAMAFFGRLTPGQRRKLLDTLGRMARVPPLGAPVIFHDQNGRGVQVWRDAGFEILFWPDHSCRELRILEIDWATM